MLSKIPRYAPRLHQLDFKVPIVQTSIESFTMQYLSPLVMPTQLSTAFSVDALAMQVLQQAAIPQSPSTSFSVDSLVLQYLVRV